MTVLDIVTAALRELGVLGAGEVAPADDAADGLVALNAWIDERAAQRLSIYTITRTTWTVTATQNYTVGIGGTINRARPVFIDHVSLVDTVPNPDNEIPLYLFNDDEWAALVIKALTSTRPHSAYYNPTYPLGTLSLYPTPTASGLQGALYAPTAVTEFAAVTDTVALPPGYRRMLIKNLAVDLAASYSRQVSQSLAQEAKESEATVKRSNIREAEMSFEGGALIQGGGWGWDIRQGP